MAHKPKNILVTGGCGFIGGCYVRMLLGRDEAITVRNLDLLTYSGNVESVAEVADDSRYTFLEGDIRDHDTVRQAMDGIDTVVHFAAEAQVDKSITGPEVFATTNVLGTQVLMDAARAAGVQRFHYVSTDEVYGHLVDEKGFFTEETPLLPNSPYSASKAGGDLLTRSYNRTFDFPVTVTRCSNNYGPYPRLDNLLPVLITRALADEPLPLYGDGLNVRDWLHVQDHCEAIEKVVREAEDGAVYNVGGNNERTNLEIAKTELNQLGKPHDLITFVKDRPGHDRRYANDASKIKQNLGWEPRVILEDGLRDTIQWFVDHQDWVAVARTRADKLAK